MIFSLSVAAAASAPRIVYWTGLTKYELMLRELVITPYLGGVAPILCRDCITQAHPLNLYKFENLHIIRLYSMHPFF